MEILAILDCGGQYTKVIDRKIRELGVRTEIYPINVEYDKLKDVGGIIISGGPESIWDTNGLKCRDELFSLNIPILGICYGMQLINHFFGGIVSPSVGKEFGEMTIDIDTSCPLFNGLSEKENVLMSHGDSVEKIAEGFKKCAASGDVVAGIYDERRNVYGVQFHPEVDLTENGMKVFDNFLRKVCGFGEQYTVEDSVDTAVDRIRSQVGNSKVIVLLSGGVDSAVSAALLLKALDKDNIYAIHIDHGFMRKNESDSVCEGLERLGLKHLKRIDAKKAFFERKIELDGRVIGPITTITDPEEKRNIIGNVFIEVVQEAAVELNLDFDKTFLAQGTLRPDLIESGNPLVSAYAHKIKTHHNDVSIVRRAREKGLIVETNWDWHKDEVRKVGRLLGLDSEITERQPFPGPGLSVRLLCNDGTDELSEDEIKAFEQIMAGQDISGQLLPLRSVGVKGDCRDYGHLVLFYGDAAAFGWNNTYALSKKVTNNIHSINRTAYILNGITKSDAKKLNCKQMYINDENVALLREIDHMVTTAIKSDKISQTFCVLLPIGINKHYSVAIRTFVTNDFMTGRPASIGSEVALELLEKLAKDIVDRFPEVELVVYDVTGKPPATCEWE